MSYTKTTWANGDTVTAEKLNNMEGGIDAAANAFVVTLTPNALDYSGTMDKTVAEINEAYEAGKRIVFSLSNGTEIYEIPAAYRCTQNGGVYFTIYLIDTYNNVLINAWTSNMLTDSTYSTKIYTLTPAT